MIHHSLIAQTCVGAALAAAAVFAAPIHGTTQDPATQARTYEFRFDPPADEAFATTVTETHDLLLQSLSTRRGDAAPIEGSVALKLRTRGEVLVADEYDVPKDRMRRRFLDAEGMVQLIDPASIDDATGQWNGDEFELTSPFAGVSVGFQAGEGQPDGYGRHFDAKALRERFLQELSVPTDWSRFLPPEQADGTRTAALDDEWVLTVADLEPLLAPTGFLAWRGGEGADEQILRAFSSGVGGNLYLAFDGQHSGSVTAKLKAVGSDPATGSYADFEIVFDVQLRADRTGFVEESRLESESGEGVETLGAELSVGLRGGATVRWGLDSGLPMGAVTICDETVEMSVSVLPPDSDPVQQSMAMIGGIANRLTFRRIPLAPARRTEGR